MKHKLRDYQQYAHDKALLLFLGNNKTPYVDLSCFPFPMGLGKTITALTLAESLYSAGKVNALMIISPKSIGGTWIEQVNNHGDFPTSPFRWNGSKAGTQKYQRELNIALDKPFPIYITNIESFQVPNKVQIEAIASLIKSHRVLVVLDESTFIKNGKAKRTINATDACRNAAGHVILAGLLVSESIVDVWAQYEFMHKWFWRERTAFLFEKRYQVKTQRRVQEGKLIEVRASMKDVYELREKTKKARDIAELQGRQVSQWVLQTEWEADDLERRLEYAKTLEKDVYAQMAPYTHWIDASIQLPELIEIDMIVEMSAKEDKVYQEMKDDLLTILDTEEVISVTTKGAFFQKSRQITGGYLDREHPIDEDISSKLRALVDDLATFEGPAVIVSNYVGAILAITEELNLIAPTVPFWSGTTQADRDIALEEFKKGNVRFIVLNPMVGAYGIDGFQVACNTMYMYDSPLSATAMKQTIARIRRSGQNKPVIIKHLMAKHQDGSDTVDQRCRMLLDDKFTMIERFHKLSKKEIKDFF